ncbi:MAG: HAMP domain-containing protein, partial [Acidobacteria bacterium]|nr:HAMP domain-containing protein [Acidobacteriota bacterium]
ERLSSEQLEGHLAALRNYALLFQQIHHEVVEIRIYAVSASGFTEVVTLPPGGPQAFPQDAVSSIREQRPRSVIEQEDRDRFTILAAAPIEAGGRTVGAVTLRLNSSASMDLMEKLNRKRLLLQVAAVISVTLLIYLLLRQLVYRRVEQLLRTMRTAQSGDLTVEAPVGALDEMGSLAIGFNEMIGRIAGIQRELEDERSSLANRVHEATAILEDRNQQLEAATAQLFHLQRRLMQMERFSAAGQLAAEFAHEVGTPLNLISGHIQLLESEMIQHPSLRRIEVIRTQTDRIERIVRRMLDVTRLPKVEHVPVHLDELLQQTGEFIAPTLALQRVSWNVVLSPDLPVIRGSPEQLQQVFINLVDNSLDAMPTGGRIQVSARPNAAGQAVVEFEDSGHGLDAATREHIFDPLFTTKRNGLGTGLGLAIVQQIIKDHGGTVDVESSPERGTRFMLRLPACDPAAV